MSALEGMDREGSGTFQALSGARVCVEKSGIGFSVCMKMKVRFSRSVGRRLELQQGTLRVNIHWTAEKWFCLFFPLPLIKLPYEPSPLLPFCLFRGCIPEPFSSLRTIGITGLSHVVSYLSVSTAEEKRKKKWQWQKEVVVSFFFDRNLLLCDVERQKMFSTFLASFSFVFNGKKTKFQHPCGCSHYHK